MAHIHDHSRRKIGSGHQCRDVGIFVGTMRFASFHAEPVDRRGARFGGESHIRRRADLDGCQRAAEFRVQTIRASKQRIRTR